MQAVAHGDRQGPRRALPRAAAPMYPLALEGALKLKEISYIHAEGYAAGELKHGPIALVDEADAVSSSRPSDSYFEKTVSNMSEVMARGGQVVLITDAEGARHAPARRPGGHRAALRSADRAAGVGRADPAAGLPRGVSEGRGRRPAAQPRQVGHGRIGKRVLRFPEGCQNEIACARPSCPWRGSEPGSCRRQDDAQELLNVVRSADPGLRGRRGARRRDRALRLHRRPRPGRHRGLFRPHRELEASSKPRARPSSWPRCAPTCRGRRDELRAPDGAAGPRPRGLVRPRRDRRRALRGDAARHADGRRARRPWPRRSRPTTRSAATSSSSSRRPPGEAHKYGIVALARRRRLRRAAEPDDRHGREAGAGDRALEPVHLRPLHPAAGDLRAAGGAGDAAPAARSSSPTPWSALMEHPGLPRPGIRRGHLRLRRQDRPAARQRRLRPEAPGSRRGGPRGAAGPSVTRVAMSLDPSSLTFRNIFSTCSRMTMPIL